MGNSVAKQLPKITYKQQELIELLYKYRFLNRIQLQAFIRHKDYKRINVWLKDLTEKQYVERIYSTDFAEKTKPAIYYLGINSIRFLREWGTYPNDELRKRYREDERSQTYLDRCSLIANCALALDAADGRYLPRATGDIIYNYFYETEADYLQESFYHELVGSEYIRPHLCIAKLKHEGSNEPVTEKSYLLEVIDPTLPRYRMRKRLSNYVEFLSTGEWDDTLGKYDEPTPTILLVCPRITDLIYAKRHTRRLLAEEWEWDDEDRPRIQFTTVEMLRAKGILGEIWEQAT